MTNQEINEAVARKLGTYPSEEAIAWAKSQVTGAGTFKITVPDYCNSIQSAWEIVESVAIWNLLRPVSGYKAQLFKHNWFEAETDTAPMAICLAFLKLP